MNDIFIGYSSSDSAIAERLVQRFQEEGWQVFIDPANAGGPEVAQGNRTGIACRAGSGGAVVGRIAR
ncbi:MAG: hypothetical protein Q8M57_03250 [Nitrosomonas sp.]|uniref:hypothetical protein n=1 Tax=Nitrosomonas sp. TaxID=42353 RepID=UPI002727A187|nr:hypothetical protein [Nitrosomonas sp.]MDO9469199.1 hypothetical protein [Nitrosomonas sp.]MDP1786029.1 hypothetical protein [Nitrosomonas sp.]MDP2223335.1 hypothetical protein [Nitrosomonas sp.]MDP3280060.1 hypothetical protein [Nitrosomonas sp.]